MPFKKKKNSNSTGTQRQGKTSLVSGIWEGNVYQQSWNVGYSEPKNPEFQRGGKNSTLKLPLGLPRLTLSASFPWKIYFRQIVSVFPLHLCVINGSRKFPVYPTLVFPPFPEWRQERCAHWKACPFRRMQRTPGPLPHLTPCHGQGDHRVS